MNYDMNYGDRDESNASDQAITPGIRLEQRLLQSSMDKDQLKSKLQEVGSYTKFNNQVDHQL